MGRPALPIGTFGKIKTCPTKTGYRARCLYRDYDGKVHSVEKAGRTKAGAQAALKLTEREPSIPWGMRWDDTEACPAEADYAVHVICELCVERHPGWRPAGLPASSWMRMTSRAS